MMQTEGSIKRTTLTKAIPYARAHENRQMERTGNSTPADTWDVLIGLSRSQMGLPYEWCFQWR